MKKCGHGAFKKLKAGYGQLMEKYLVILRLKRVLLVVSVKRNFIANLKWVTLLS